MRSRLSQNIFGKVKNHERPKNDFSHGRFFDDRQNGVRRKYPLPSASTCFNGLRQKEMMEIDAVLEMADWRLDQAEDFTIIFKNPRSLTQPAG